MSCVCGLAGELKYKCDAQRKAYAKCVLNLVSTSLINTSHVMFKWKKNRFPQFCKFASYPASITLKFVLYFPNKRLNKRLNVNEIIVLSLQ